MKDNLKDRYINKVIPTLIDKLEIKNIMAIPKICKVVINRGIGESTVNSAVIELTVNQLIKLTGQKPILRKSKKSISNFKLREGQVIGCKVTLRRQKMYDFLDKFINITCAKIRDFRGFPDTFDDHGNMTIGIRETESIFPEVMGSLVDKVHGLSITIVTSATNRVDAKALLVELGFPFRNK
eukprot:COSAG01_NODE_1_length_100484_cov_170.446142_79_plen_182_part_00